jgi:hypothetical protein
VGRVTARPRKMAPHLPPSPPLPRAGGYGIQGVAGSFVTGIQGCYYNVMGFPLHRFSAVLRALVEEEAAGAAAWRGEWEPSASGAAVRESR